jgi:hypothetical protein
MIFGVPVGTQNACQMNVQSGLPPASSAQAVPFGSIRGNMFLLAHLSDPHLSPLPTPRWSEVAGKRAIGLLNWRRRRHFIHRSDVLAHIVADLKAIGTLQFWRGDFGFIKLDGSCDSIFVHRSRLIAAGINPEDMAVAPV